MESWASAFSFKTCRFEFQFWALHTSSIPNAALLGGFVYIWSTSQDTLTFGGQEFPPWSRHCLIRGYVSAVLKMGEIDNLLACHVTNCAEASNQSALTLSGPRIVVLPDSVVQADVSSWLSGFDDARAHLIQAYSDPMGALTSKIACVVLRRFTLLTLAYSSPGRKAKSLARNFRIVWHMIFVPLSLLTLKTHY